MQIYHQTQATAGQLLSPRALDDAVLTRNLGIIAELYEQHRRGVWAHIERLAARLLRAKSK